MKETRFNIGMNTLKQIDGLHPRHPLCGISTRTECTVYGESGL